MTLLLVTHNKHKVEEISSMLAQAGTGTRPAYTVISLDAIKEPPPIQETGETFRENAQCKNVSLLSWLYGLGNQSLEALFPSGRGYLLADDSGLEVDALGGAPGVYSARYAAEETGASGNSSDTDNNAKLLRELLEKGDGNRKARFVCMLALTPIEIAADPADLLEETEFFEGTCEGRIALEAHGVKGFGYDPLFIPDGFDQSFAELGESIKNQMSHRAKALKNLIHFLNTKI